jgi:hypothetical protein
MSKQFEKTHATTVIATAAILPYRFVSLSGAYAVGDAPCAGLTDALGVSESAAAPGEALSVVTAFSFPVEAEATIARGDYLKPGTEGGAIVGSFDDHCAIALEAGVAGEIIEARILPHAHPSGA